MAVLLDVKQAYPDAKLVVGNTEVGIEMKFKDARYKMLVGVTHVPELNRLEVKALHRCLVWTSVNHRMTFSCDH